MAARLWADDLPSTPRALAGSGQWTRTGAGVSSSLQWLVRGGAMRDWIAAAFIGLMLAALALEWFDVLVY